jgi:hypothetical protein
MTNPFDRQFGNDISFDEVREMFIADNKIAEIFCSKQNTFVWGVRGTGKSMLLKYYDLESQMGTTSAKEFLHQSPKFLGIYLEFKSGVFNFINLSREQQVSAIPIYDSIIYAFSEHIIVSAILEMFIKKMNPILNSFDAERVSDFLSDVCSILRINTPDNANSAYETILALNAVIKQEKSKSIEAIKRYTIGQTIDYDKLMFFDYAGLLEIIKSFRLTVKKETSEDAPTLYLMLDDVDNLFPYQQQMINTWLGQREFSNVCFKIACEPFKYKAFDSLADGRRIIQRTHDYNEIILDLDIFIDHKSRERIYRGIANKRLEQVAVTDEVDVITIDKLFPEDVKQKNKFEEIKTTLYSEVDSGKITLSQRDISRLVWPKIHEKGFRVYSGFSDIVHLSFGNVRRFLEICQRIVSDSQVTSLKSISSKQQNKTIKNLSKQRFTFQYGVPDDIDLKLQSLITNLLSFFKYRLIECTDSAERTFDAFVVKNYSALSDDAQKVIRRGLEQSWFRRVYYTRRESHIRQEVFILNKMLFPDYNLNISEVGGRFELTNETFENCIKRDDYLIRYINKGVSSDQISIFDLDFEDLEKEDIYDCVNND